MDRYEEALERAKKGLPIDEVFPELKESKESEDEKNERIRKFIVETIFRQYGDSQEYLDVLAYLEKQKEQKPESCDCSRDEESYTNGIHHVLMNPEAYGLIKQKPAAWSEDERIRKQLLDIVAFIPEANFKSASREECRTYLDKQKAQKQEWSEEDERTLESFLGWLQGSMGEKTYSSWLKSLPERFSLKPKQEWSEEDERITAKLLSYFNEFDESTSFGSREVIEIRHWLKSLRPQPHWKPSMEQIEALENSTALNEEQGAHLYSLLCDLKKLL